MSTMKQTKDTKSMPAKASKKNRHTKEHATTAKRLEQAQALCPHT